MQRRELLIVLGATAAGVVAGTGGKAKAFHIVKVTRTASTRAAVLRQNLRRDLPSLRHASCRGKARPRQAAPHYFRLRGVLPSWRRA